MTAATDTRPDLEATLAKCFYGRDGHFHQEDDSPWTDTDDQALDLLLDLFDHMATHDPVECGLNTPPEYLAAHGRHEWTAIREAEELTLDDIAEIVGVDKTSISRWENGRRSTTNRKYQDWLRAADQRQAERMSTDIWRLVCRRDGWTPTQLDRYGARNHWDVVWKDNGLYSKWESTGTLPSFTPGDAGLAD